jgi:hypothetical protein
MSEELITKKNVKGIIARWRIKHNFDHECYQKIFLELYKKINEHGKHKN